MNICTFDKATYYVFATAANTSALAVIFFIPELMKNKRKIVKQLFYFGLIFCGIIANLTIPSLTNMTLINPLFLYIVYVISGILLFGVLNKLTKSFTFGSTYFINRLFQILFGFTTFGGLTCFLFLYLNMKILTNIKQEIVQVKIIRTGFERKRHQGPKLFADINIKGFEKRIYFSENSRIDNLLNLNLKIRKGYFGYEIIQTHIEI